MKNIKSYKIFERKLISQVSKKNLVNFMSQKRHDLKDETIEELRNNSILRPDEPLKLYRGLLFDKSIDIKNNTYHYKSNRPSSWTKDNNIATRFAKYGYLNTDSSLIANFYTSLRKGMIDGQIGIIIGHTFEPNEILVDIEKIPNKMNNHQWVYEKEVIIEPIDKRIKILKIFTKKNEYNSIEEFLNRDMGNNYQEILDLYKKPLSNIYPHIKKIYDEFESFYKKDTKTFLNYLIKLDKTRGMKIKENIKKYYQIFHNLYNDVPELDVPEFGVSKEDEKLEHKLSIIKKKFNKFDTIKNLNVPQSYYTTYFYEQEIISNYFRKNIGRMKRQNVEKLKVKLEREMGISLEKLAELYKYYVGLFNNIVFSMKYIPEELFKLGDISTNQPTIYNDW